MEFGEHALRGGLKVCDMRVGKGIDDSHRDSKPMFFDRSLQRTMETIHVGKVNDRTSAREAQCIVETK